MQEWQHPILCPLNNKDKYRSIIHQRIKSRHPSSLQDLVRTSTKRPFKFMELRQKKRQHQGGMLVTLEQKKIIFKCYTICRHLGIQGRILNKYSLSEKVNQKLGIHEENTLNTLMEKNLSYMVMHKTLQGSVSSFDPHRPFSRAPSHMNIKSNNFVVLRRASWCQLARDAQFSKEKRHLNHQSTLISILLTCRKRNPCF